MYRKEYRKMFEMEGKMWWYVSLRDLIFYYTLKYAEGRTLLDAGCGTGKNMEYLNAKGYETYGIDISKDAIKFCKKRGVKNIQLANVDNIPFEKESFDTIIATDVLGMLKDNDIKKSLSEFKRVLKSKGLLIIHGAALESLRSQHDTVTGIRKRFTKKELERFLNPDWRIIKSSYRIFFLFIPIFLIKLFKRFFKSKTKAISDQYLPPKIINSLLVFIQLIENRLLKIINLPVGSSLFIVAKRKG